MLHLQTTGLCFHHLLGVCAWHRRGMCGKAGGVPAAHEGPQCLRGLDCPCGAEVKAQWQGWRSSGDHRTPPGVTVCVGRSRPAQEVDAVTPEGIPSLSRMAWQPWGRRPPSFGGDFQLLLAVQWAA